MHQSQIASLLESGAGAAPSQPVSIIAIYLQFFLSSRSVINTFFLETARIGNHYVRGWAAASASLCSRFFAFSCDQQPFCKLPIKEVKLLGLVLLDIKDVAVPIFNARAPLADSTAIILNRINVTVFMMSWTRSYPAKH